MFVLSICTVLDYGRRQVKMKFKGMNCHWKFSFRSSFLYYSKKKKLIPGWYDNLLQTPHKTEVRVNGYSLTGCDVKRIMISLQTNRNSLEPIYITDTWGSDPVPSWTALVNSQLMTFNFLPGNTNVAANVRVNKGGSRGDWA